ncbi:MAG: hypothetical protein NW206_06845 [Hyphomonadaceae bacterium]|nr:hypothetical protein [Hyphomonadaceae bacterium]
MNDDNHERVAPEVALDRFLTAIKNQADIDPAFRNNLLLALGVTVVFDGENDLANVAPHIVAAHKDELSFRAIYGRLPVAKLRSVLTKSGLATKSDLTGKSQDDILDMLWGRAVSRAEERGLRVG